MKKQDTERTAVLTKSGKTVEINVPFRKTKGRSFSTAEKQVDKLLSKGYKLTFKSKGGKAAKKGKVKKAGKSSLLMKGFQSPISAEEYPKSIKELSSLIGIGLPKEEINVDMIGFIRALEVDENPLPYLHKSVDKARKLKIMLTYDESGSCHFVLRPLLAFADSLVKSPDVDVYLAPNFNGHIQNEKDLSQTKEFDLILYFGDVDIYRFLPKWVEKKAYQKLLCLSVFNKKHSEPYRNEVIEKDFNHNNVFINAVDPECDDTVAKAIRMASKVLK